MINTENPTRRQVVLGIISIIGLGGTGATVLSIRDIGDIYDISAAIEKQVRPAPLPGALEDANTTIETYHQDIIDLDSQGQFGKIHEITDPSSESYIQEKQAEAIVETQQLHDDAFHQAQLQTQAYGPLGLQGRTVRDDAISIAGILTGVASVISAAAIPPRRVRQGELRE
ncbi:MAG TPA: hypothetical protein VGT05_00410 [Patescibacteria group bacterium]|nr:hypothetical protein [Patescibacteria group bacterium]